jgi:hypothetical protein
MRLAVFGKMLLALVLLFNLLFILCTIVLALYSGKEIGWSWYFSQYPGLFLYPAACGTLTFLGFRLSTIRIRYENRVETAIRLLEIVKSLRYELEREQPSWSVFKVKSRLRRIFPGFEDTLLLHRGPAEFEVTAYREDSRVIQKAMGIED